MIKIINLAVGFALFLHGSSWAQKPPTNSRTHETFELTGNLSFDVASDSAFVRSVAVTIGDGGNGPYKAIMVGDTSLRTHTLYRPKDLGAVSGKLPIVVWANGGCWNGSGGYRNFLSNIASYGFLVIAIGPVKNALTGDIGGGGTDARLLLKAIDWATQRNQNPSSIYYGKIDTSRIAAMGQSCGGLQALSVLRDPRIKTIVAFNSGLFATPPAMSATAGQGGENRPRPALPNISKTDLQSLHSSVAYFVGGEYDMATPNAKDDFSRIAGVPVLLARYDFSESVKNPRNKIYGRFYGHYPATYKEPNGGDFAAAGVAWLQWQLKGDKEAAKLFSGTNCGYCSGTNWTIEKKNMD